MGIFEDKYFVFLTSAGRTGTKFFGDLLGDMIDGAFSVHEPDVLMDFKLKSLRQLRYFGLYKLIIGKLMRKTGIRNLSQNFLSGQIKLIDLKAAIVDHRDNYYRSIDRELIIESYSGWYGAIPAIQSLYKNYKIVVIVRDPRDWVVSNMNWGTMYGKRDWVSRLGLGRLDPAMIGDTQLEQQWQNFSQFQKLCWAWKTIYEIILVSAERDANTIIFKFEDLFRSEKKYENMEKLLSFISKFPAKNFKYNIPQNILEKQVNTNISYEFSRQGNWDTKMNSELIRICSKTAKKFKYAVNTSSISG
jgi:hypothetical protein